MKPGNPALAPADGMVVASVNRFRQGEVGVDSDLLARECAVALEFNGVSHAVMLATPRDLEDFALGFAYSEGIIERASQCYGIEASENDAGWTIRIDIAAASFNRLKQARRNLAGRTGCGLCGAESLAHVLRPLPDLTGASLAIEADSIGRALSALSTHQAIGAATGATHAAAWAGRDGDLRLVREDVGRHNALDKLIGAGLRSGHAQWQEGFLIVTSRASMEMVQKCAMAGFAMLVALSAPTDLAVRLAQEHGICLLGFAAPGHWTMYSHPWRLRSAESRSTTTF